MANSLTASEIKQYKDDIDNSKALMDKALPDGNSQSMRDEMRDYRRFVRGLFTKTDVGYKSSKPVPANEFNGNLETMKPVLYFQNPYILVSPASDKFLKIKQDPKQAQTGTDVITEVYQYAQASEYLLNYMSNQDLDDETVISECVDDILTCGFCNHKSGWLTDDNPSYTKTNWEDNKTLEQRENEKGTQRLLEAKKLNSEEIQGETMQDITPPDVDELTSQRISPFNTLFDPDGDINLKTSRYAGERVIMPTEYLNKMFGLSLKGRESKLFADSGENDTQSTNLKLKRNELVELWNIEKRQVVYFVDEIQDRPILVKDWLWNINGFPYTTCTFNKDNDRLLPIPDFRQYKHLVFEKMRIVTKLSELLKRLHRVFLADDRISAKLDDILNGGEATVVPVNRKPETDNANPTSPENLENFIKAVADFTVSESYFAYLRVIDSQIERMSGITDYERGIVGAIKRTATEMNSLSSVQNLKIERRRGILKKWIVEINKKRLQLLQQNLTIKKRIQILQKGKLIFPSYDKNDILGDFSFDLDVTTMIKKNKTLAQKYSLEKYTQLKDDPYEQGAGRKKLLIDVHKSYDDIDIDDRLTDPQPPAPPTPEPPKISISLRLDAIDLTNPQVMQLLQSKGVQIEPLQAPTAGVGNLPTGAIPQNEAVNLEKGAMQV